MRGKGAGGRPAPWSGTARVRAPGAVTPSRRSAPVARERSSCENPDVRKSIDDELLALVAETNDQRRVVGQALVALHRALLLPRDREFVASVQKWAPGASLLFGSMETRLRRLSPHRRDDALRRWLNPVLARLADDLERGDRGRLSFLAWLQGRFLDLTRLLKEEARGTKIHDLVLARDLGLVFGAVARGSVASAASALRAGGRELVASDDQPVAAPASRPPRGA